MPDDGCRISGGLVWIANSVRNDSTKGKAHSIRARNIQAFTKIELVIVIAVPAVLIVLPQAHRCQCVQQIRPPLREGEWPTEFFRNPLHVVGPSPDRALIGMADIGNFRRPSDETPAQLIPNLNVPLSFQ